MDGLLRGNASFFVKQLAAVLISSAWAGVVTLAMLWVINKITPVRVEEAHEHVGLDEALHGEQAYPQAM